MRIGSFIDRRRKHRKRNASIAKNFCATRGGGGKNDFHGWPGQNTTETLKKQLCFGCETKGKVMAGQVSRAMQSSIGAMGRMSGRWLASGCLPFDWRILSALLAGRALGSSRPKTDCYNWRERRKEVMAKATKSKPTSTGRTISQRA